jgi:hypothetical protein
MTVGALFYYAIDEIKYNIVDIKKEMVERFSFKDWS